VTIFGEFDGGSLDAAGQALATLEHIDEPREFGRSAIDATRESGVKRSGADIATSETTEQPSIGEGVNAGPFKIAVEREQFVGLGQGLIDAMDELFPEARCGGTFEAETVESISENAGWVGGHEVLTSAPGRAEQNCSADLAVRRRMPKGFVLADLRQLLAGSEQAWRKSS
jgi:hypothetical protein